MRADCYIQLINAYFYSPSIIHVVPVLLSWTLQKLRSSSSHGRICTTNTINTPSTPFQMRALTTAAPLNSSLPQNTLQTGSTAPPHNQMAEINPSTTTYWRKHAASHTFHQLFTCLRAPATPSASESALLLINYLNVRQNESIKQNLHSLILP